MHALSALGDLYQNLALGAPKARVSPPKYKKRMIKNLFQLINRGCHAVTGVLDVKFLFGWKPKAPKLAKYKDKMSFSVIL